jgi:hypothetical protein
MSLAGGGGCFRVSVRAPWPDVLGRDPSFTIGRRDLT